MCLCAVMWMVSIAPAEVRGQSTPTLCVETMPGMMMCPQKGRGGEAGDEDERRDDGADGADAAADVCAGDPASRGVGDERGAEFDAGGDADGDEGRVDADAAWECVCDRAAADGAAGRGQVFLDELGHGDGGAEGGAGAVDA